MSKIHSLENIYNLWLLTQPQKTHLIPKNPPKKILMNKRKLIRRTIDESKPDATLIEEYTDKIFETNINTKENKISKPININFQNVVNADQQRQKIRHKNFSQLMSQLG